MGFLLRGSIGRRLLISLASATAAVLGAATGAGAAAVNAPYSDNFNSDTGSQNAPNFTSTNGTWAVSSGTYQNSIPTTIAASSTIQVNNLGGGSTQGFSESATVSTDAAGQGNSNYFFGLAALGQVADVSNSSLSNSSTSTFYTADITGAGVMRIIKVVTGNQGTALGSGATFAGGLVAGTTYTETLTGLYSGGALNFAFSVSNGTTTQTATGTDSSSLLTGQFFGFRDRNAATGTLNATWDNYSLALAPEPASLGLLGVAALTLLHRRRGKTDGGNPSPKDPA